MRVRNAPLLLKQNADLPRDAQMPQAVRAVARHFEINRDVAADVRDRLEVQPRQGQPLGQGLDGHIELQIVREPVPTDDHGTEPN